MDELCFGNCSNERECEAEWPKEISIANIARMNRDFLRQGLVQLHIKVKTMIKIRIHKGDPNDRD
jgi:hypothetical protein